MYLYRDAIQTIFTLKMESDIAFRDLSEKYSLRSVETLKTMNFYKSF